jgi:clan AA aspartic protease (TIGR02281 family)
MKNYFLGIAFFFTACLQAQDVIKMEKTGGVYKVPCKINGLPLKFIFDTGASDVSISLTEALFMVKNDYLKESDFRGTEYYRIANGDIAEGTKVILRTVEIGKQKLYNVEASIVHSLEAPLLFGQSALQRFGRFTVDYTNSTLIIGGSNTTATTTNHAEKPVSTTTTAPSYSNAGTVSDIDGQVYKTVKIGNQVWMAENLNVERFRNGDLIPHAKTEEEWKKAGENKQPAWCYYDNDPANGKKYGKLYNWYAVNDPRGLAPKGWHIPGDEEWTTLIDYLGGESRAGAKMKSTSGWAENGNGNNKGGFSGLPGGLRFSTGVFNYFNKNGYWWSSSEYYRYNAWNRNLNYFNNDINRNYNDLEKGLSVRCLRD